MNPVEKSIHEQIRAEARKFAEEEIKPVAASLDETGEFSLSLTKRMGETGLFGMSLPETYGGKNRDTLAYIIAVEELARIDGSQSATLAAQNSLGIGPLYKYGSDTQRKKLLPRLTTGDMVWAFGLTEANAGSDSRGTQTTAVLDGDDYVINGSKTFITNSASAASGGATIQVVTGEKDGKKELTVFYVDKDTPGYRSEVIDNKMMWRAADTGKLFFDNVRIPKTNMIGKLGEGARIMLDTLDSGRLSIAAMGLGLAQGAYEMAFEYSRKREQFGRPIYKFQAIAFKLADMATKIELARNLLYKACWLKDNKQAFGKEAAMAKLYCGDIAKEVSDEAVQIHGAYGLFKNNDIERFYRDQRILQIGEGTSEILRLVISRHIGLK